MRDRASSGFGDPASGPDDASVGRPTNASAGPLRTTVVIPVKDDKVHLERCLAALAQQTRRADEIIVVDNRSSDGSAALARAHGVRIVPCEIPGIPASAATGYDAAGTDLILRLDADCIPPATWVAQVVEAFRARPDVGAFTGDARFYDGPVVGRALAARLYLWAYTVLTAPALGHRPLFGSNLAIRRDAWRAVRREVHRGDPDLHDDLDLAYHLGNRYRIARMRGEPMAISMRPLFSLRSFRRRVEVGFRTVLVHWPAEFPPLRWMRRQWHSLREAVAS